MSKPGILYLIPTTLGKTPSNNTIPESVLEVIRSLDVFIVENIQSAIRFLQWVGDTKPTYEIEFFVLNKRTPEQEAFSFLKPLLDGKDVGLISEAGSPAVADPGAVMVKMAHSRNIRVAPLVGPSSILLALMGAGFNGQQFAFHGYLPIDSKERKKKLQQLEFESQRQNCTQIFMEAPHRNNEILTAVLESCNPDTKFCTATDLTLPTEEIISRSVSSWKSTKKPDLHKRPTIFLLYSA